MESATTRVTTGFLRSCDSRRTTGDREECFGSAHAFQPQTTQLVWTEMRSMSLPQSESLPRSVPSHFPENPDSAFTQRANSDSSRTIFSSMPCAPSIDDMQWSPRFRRKDRCTEPRTVRFEVSRILASCAQGCDLE